MLKHFLSLQNSRLRLSNDVSSHFEKRLKDYLHNTAIDHRCLIAHGRVNVTRHFD